MAGPTGISPVPVAVTHDPLGRAMTEEQRQRLREQLAPPAEEASAKERVLDRRRDGASHEPPAEAGGSAAAPARDDTPAEPGSIIDVYA